MAWSNAVMEGISCRTRQAEQLAPCPRAGRIIFSGRKLQLDGWPGIAAHGEETARAGTLSWCACLISISLLAMLPAPGTALGQEAYTVHVTDLDSSAVDPAVFDSSTETSIHWEATFQEESPWAIPRTQPARTELPMAALNFSSDLFGGTAVGLSLLTPSRQTYAAGPATDLVLGIESVTRGATDAGNLIGKSVSMRGLNVQRRNPIVTEARIRGSRVGSTPASGSFWVPARMDLDTALSKIDSRLLSDVIAIQGPYAARYGPNLSHLDFELLPSPRYADGFQTHGLTGADYKANGKGWYGRQMVWGGGSDWGFRAAYGHRTGNDYTAGSGAGVPSSYNSRDLNVALGRDFSDERRLEFNYLRLDQTGVELPGQAFDIDVLSTDGCEVAYTVEEPPCGDRMEVAAWYNRTRLAGSAQRPGKRRQFPYYDQIDFVGFTDVDSQSSGFRWTLTWEGVQDERLDVGADLRYVQQRLDEITDGYIDLHFWNNANSPIPPSFLANPGLFAEYTAPLGERCLVRAGTRADLVSTSVTGDPATLASLGTQSLPLADILGTDDFSRSHGLWAAYVTGQYEIDCCWTAEVATGYAQRPPSLTELYAAEPFMFVLQNGLNIVTGDPSLKPEQIGQIDIGLRFGTDRLRGKIVGYHGWAWDYITFENMGYQPGPTGEVEQEQLKYVNTQLATFVGTELYGEFDLNDWLRPFAALSYVDGRDRTRNGRFATDPSAPGRPSTRQPGLPRGASSGIAGAEQEPLPGISPLESWLGLRLHQPADAPRWSLELSARLVNRQERVATSLFETPTPGFTVWNIRGYWRATDQLLLIAGVENFGNRTYREHLDFRSPSGIQMFQPGANFYCGGEVTY